MAPHLFWLKYINYIFIYLPILFCSILFHWILFRKYIVGFLDPLFILVAGFTFNVSTLFYVFYVTDGASAKLFVLFAMQLTYYLGFILSAPKVVLFKKRILNDKHPIVKHRLGLLTVFLVVSSCVYVIAVLLEYCLAGIPLFKLSRQGTFSGTGMGIITRFQDIGSLVSYIFAAKLLIMRPLLNLTWKVVRILLLVVITIFSVLSGSKGAFLGFTTIAYLLFVAMYYKTHIEFPKILTLRNAFISVIIFSTAMIALYITPATGSIFEGVSNSKTALTILALFYRLVNYGDIYIYSFIDDAITSLPASGGLVSLFSGVLSTFRMLPIDVIPIHLGYDLALNAMPSMSEVGGPNANFNVFGYHYFSIGACFFFSIVVGIFTGICRFIMLTKLPALLYSNKSITSCCYIIFSLIGINAAVDTPYTISRLVSLFLFLLLTIPISLAIYGCGRKATIQSSEVVL